LPLKERLPHLVQLIRRQGLGEVRAPDFRTNVKGKGYYFDGLMRVGTDTLFRGRHHLLASSGRYLRTLNRRTLAVNAAQSAAHRSFLGRPWRYCRRGARPGTGTGDDLATTGAAFARRCFIGAL